MSARSAALVFIFLPVFAAGQTVPDTTGWECSFCNFPAGVVFNFDTGVGFVTDESYRSGDYRGFDDEGAIFIGDFDLRYWAGNGGYWEAQGRDLGLDSRSLSLEGGRQGRYSLRLSYDNLPRQLFDFTRTPFSGFNTLSLPSGWVTGGSTAAMTELGNSLVPIGIGYERENLGLELSFIQSNRIQYDIDYRHENRDGNRIHAGNFLTQSSLLPEPIDYVTDQIDASISYVGERGQARLNYYASLFSNTAHSLAWDNPFTPLVPGAASGRMAMPPDNQAHQLSFSGALRLTAATRLSGTLAFGKLEQDDLFVPLTINPVLAGTALPVASLNGKVDTRKANLRLDTRPLSKLRVRVEFDIDDRDNKTARNDYAVVESDLFSSGMRTNVPYSFKRSRIDLKGDYRLDRKLTISSGYRYREIERDFQEVRTTDEQSAWLGARFRAHEGKLSAASVKFGRDERDGSNYLMPTDPITDQNPLLRKYNMADRDRDFVQASVSLVPSERIDVGIEVESADEDYESTTVGLLASDSQRLNLDAAIRLSDKAFLTLFYGRETIESAQAGSASFGAADWSAAIEDEIDTFSAGLRLPQLREKVDLTLDYVFSDSTGRIALTPTVGGTDNFPDLRTRLYSIRLYADYMPTDRHTIRAGYYYERLKARDWMLDGITPNTLPSILSLGAQSPNYAVGMFSVSFQYSLANGPSDTSE